MKWLSPAENMASSSKDSDLEGEKKPLIPTESKGDKEDIYRQVVETKHTFP